MVILKNGITILLCLLLSACGFHLQGILPLAPPLQRLYIQGPDPYGNLARILQQYLLMSGVTLVNSAVEASTVLTILHDGNSQKLLSVNITQQTRQYNISVTVQFEISDNTGRVILPTQTLVETRTLTVQSDQILGSSNEASMLYQQMRRTLAYAIMNRLASAEVTKIINNAFQQKEKS